MKSFERRLAQLEKKLKPLKESDFRRKMMKVLSKYSVPTRKEFLEAIMYKDKLEFVDSDWAREILAKGGKEEWLEVVDMIEEFIEEKSRKIS